MNKKSLQKRIKIGWQNPSNMIIYNQGKGNKNKILGGIKNGKKFKITKLIQVI